MGGVLSLTPRFTWELRILHENIAEHITNIVESMDEKDALVILPLLIEKLQSALDILRSPQEPDA